MTIRSLPKGAALPVQVQSIEGRAAVVEVVMDGEAEELGLHQPVEVSVETAVYLGVVAQREQRAGTWTLWLDLEHCVDRLKMAEVQSAWGERATSEKF